MQPLPFWRSPTSTYGRAVGLTHRYVAVVAVCGRRADLLSELASSLQAAFHGTSSLQLLASAERVLSTNDLSWRAGTASPSRRAAPSWLRPQGPCLILQQPTLSVPQMTDQDMAHTVLSLQVLL